MQLRHFVSGSALLLSAWLVVTFFHKVPTQRYARPEIRSATSMNDSITPSLRVDATEAPSEEVAPETSGYGNSELVRVSDSQ